MWVEYKSNGVNYKWVWVQYVYVMTQNTDAATDAQIEVGDVFENDWFRYEVIGTSDADNKILCENTAGLESWMTPAELKKIELDRLASQF